MKKIVISTEEKILLASYEIFLLFGYHGTTLHKIAMKAGVNKSAVHYYFRSKERLYAEVVKKVFGNIFNKRVHDSGNQIRLKIQIWFMLTELYNNKDLFERTLKEIYPDDWNKKLTKLKKWLDFKDNPYYNVLDLWQNVVITSDKSILAKSR